MNKRKTKGVDSGKGTICIAAKDKDILQYVNSIYANPTPGVRVLIDRFKFKGDEGLQNQRKSNAR